MPRGVALVVSVRKNPRDRSHSLRLADLESPSGTKMRMFSLSAVLPHIIITFPPRERGSTSDIRVKKAEARRRVFLCANLSHSDCGWCPAAPWCCGGCEWMDEDGWGGRAGEQQHHSRSKSTSASCRQTMWEPMCPRMQMPPSQAGMGSAMGSRSCMRTERDATHRRLSVSVI